MLLFFAVVPAIFAVAAVVDVTAAVVAAAAAVVVAAAATDISKTESFFFHPNLFLLSLSLIPGKSCSSISRHRLQIFKGNFKSWRKGVF